MSWGWRTLSPRWLNVWTADSGKPAEYDDPEVRKIAVLMTDGENTPWQSDDPETEAQTYTNLIDTCAAMQDKGIVIYTITFKAPPHLDPHYSSCATTPDHHFFRAPTEADLQIGRASCRESVCQYV